MISLVEYAGVARCPMSFDTPILGTSLFVTFFYGNIIVFFQLSERVMTHES